MSRNPRAGMTTEQELHHLCVENERCKNRIRNLERELKPDHARREGQLRGLDLASTSMVLIRRKAGEWDTPYGQGWHAACTEAIDQLEAKVFELMDLRRPRQQTLDTTENQ